MGDAPWFLQAFAWLGIVWAGVGVATCLALAVIVAVDAYREWLNEVGEPSHPGVDIDIGSLLKVLADDGDRLLDEGEDRFVPWDEVKRDHGLTGPPETWSTDPSGWQSNPGPGAP